jgi:beta-phosphoglucomutase-like phosphatase (HAD superfamily)
MTIEVPEDIKLVLFDCDGTLAHTLDIHWNAWLAVLAEYDAGDLSFGETTSR